MALFQSIYDAKNCIYNQVIALKEDAKNNEQKEYLAAVQIQSLFRGQLVRSIITRKTKAEIVIARVYRGHSGRRLCNSLVYRMKRIEACAVRHYFAIRIQSRVRGMISRAKILNFKERKAYVAQIANKGEKLRRNAMERFKQQQIDELQQCDIEAKAELSHISKHLHYLVSTKAVPGVFNAQMAASGPPTAFGIPVEDHIKTNSRKHVVEKLAQQPIPTSLQPFPPSNKSSIQASSVYGADLKAVRAHKKYHRQTHIGKRDFQTITQKKQEFERLNKGPGVSAGTPYLEDRKNPYKIRGIPRSKDDLLPALTTLGKYQSSDNSKPFYLTSGGNKSKIYPNDRFDV